MIAFTVISAGVGAKMGTDKVVHTVICNVGYYSTITFRSLWIV